MGRCNIIKICPLAIIEKYICEEKTIPQTAEELGVSISFIIKKNFEYGISKLLIRPRRKYKNMHLDINFIKDLYLKENKSTKYISEKLNVNLGTVKTILYDLGIMRVRPTKMKGNIKCEVCGKYFFQLSLSHFKKHGMTCGDYRKLFPNAQISMRKGKTWEEIFGKEFAYKNKMRLRKRLLEDAKFTITDTKEQLLLKEILESLGIRIEKETCFGGFFIDCYSPDFHIGFEADGPWHNSKRDERRDSFLLDQCQLPLLRFSNEEINDYKFLDTLKNRIIDFVDIWRDSSISRKKVSSDFMWDVGTKFIFSAWRKGKIRKYDEELNIYYWTLPKMVRKVCAACGKIFEIDERDNRRTCSETCSNKLHSIIATELNKIKRGGTSKGDIGYTIAGHTLVKVKDDLELWRTKSGNFQVYQNDIMILKGVDDYNKAEAVFNDPELAKDVKGDVWNRGLSASTNDKVADIGTKISQSRVNGNYDAHMGNLSIIRKEKAPQQKCPKCGMFRINLGDKYVCSNELCSEFYFIGTGKSEIDKTDIDRMYEKFAPLVSNIKRDRNGDGQIYNDKYVAMYINRKNKYEVYKIVNKKYVPISRNIVDLFDACKAMLLAKVSQ